MAVKVIQDASAARRSDPALDMAVTAVAATFCLAPRDVHRACLTGPCRGECCHSPEYTETRRWSVCCSNTAKECRRMVAYFRRTEKHYAVENLWSTGHDRDDAVRDTVLGVESIVGLSKSARVASNLQRYLNRDKTASTEELHPERGIYCLESLHMLPWDMQMVCTRHAYIPRVAFCDNNYDAKGSFSELFHGKKQVELYSAGIHDHYDGIYTMLFPYRRRLYNIIFSNRDESHALSIREVLFFMGTARCSDVLVQPAEGDVLSVLEQCRSEHVSQNDTCCHPFYTILQYIVSGQWSSTGWSVLTEATVGMDRLSLELLVTCSIIKHVASLLRPPDVEKADCIICPVLVSFIATVMYCKWNQCASEGAADPIASLHLPESAGLAFQWSIIELCVQHANYATCVATMTASSLNATCSEAGLSVMSYMDPILYGNIYNTLMSAEYDFSPVCRETPEYDISESFRKTLFDCLSLPLSPYKCCDIESLVDSTCNLINLIYDIR